jgi:hypothetical protein
LWGGDDELDDELDADAPDDAPIVLTDEDYYADALESTR